MKKHLSTQTRKRMLSSIGLILFSVSFVLAQVLVKGTVKDNLGEGVPGASVQVKGTSQGTITDLDGKFAFNVPNKNSILVISFIGYVTVEMKVDTQKPMVITLKEDTKTLDEVVVVGYQEIRKKDLTGSVAKASMAELLSTPTASFGETLGGRIAGVNVSSGEGMPGGQMNIVIRGNNSLTQDNSPLYVIDGFPVEDPSIAAAINQNDIESLDFLKDASATAIYGARGANGVVMITTKKGTIGQPKIKYDGSFGIQHITKTIPMMDAYEFVKLQAERSPKDMETTYFMNYDGKKWGLEDYRNIPQYNWQDEIFRSAWMQSHNVSLTGGSEGVRYNASLSYYDQDGILLESNYKRVQGRMGTTIQKKKLKIYLTTNYSSTTTTGGSPSQNSYSGMNNLFYSVWGYRPVTEPDRPLNSLMDNIMDDAINNTNDYRFNPIMSLKNEYRKTYANYIQFNGFAEYEFIKGLKLKVSGGYTFDTRKGETFNNSKTRYGNPKSSDKVNAEIYHSQRATWLNENILTYQTNIKRKHFFNSMVGVTLQNSDYEYYSYKTVQIPNEALGMAGMSEGTPSTTKSLKSSWSMLSFLGRLNYNYKSLYYATVSFRSDGSSRFAKGHQWGFFPSAAVGWRVSEEAFFAPLKKAISNAKFRASYGSLGNNSGVGRYEQKETMGTTNYIVGNNGLATGFSANKMINQDLSWEETRVINIGLDLGFFNNRLTAELDWYDRFTTGMIRGSSISSLLTGYSAPNINVADLRNRGIEVNLNWQSSIRKFEYSVNVNASYNVNKLEKWGDYLNRGWIMLDMPYHFLYIYEAYPGLVQSWNQLYNAPYQGDAYNAPGDIILKDLNGDGKISDLDKKAYTDKYRDTPMGQFGITLTGAYQGFDIQALFQGNYGRSDVWLDDLNNTKIPDNRYAFQQFHWSDSWSLDNRGASLPRLLNGSGGNKNREESTYWAYNTNYFRLKNLQVGYTVPERYMQRIGFNRARIYLSGENLFTLTPWKGIDPEKPHGNDLYPLVKTYSIGLNIEF